MAPVDQKCSFSLSYYFVLKSTTRSELYGFILRRNVMISLAAPDAIFKNIFPTSDVDICCRKKSKSTVNCSRSRFDLDLRIISFLLSEARQLFSRKMNLLTFVLLTVSIDLETGWRSLNSFPFIQGVAEIEQVSTVTVTFERRKRFVSAAKQLHCFQPWIIDSHLWIWTHFTGPSFGLIIKTSSSE